MRSDLGNLLKALGRLDEAKVRFMKCVFAAAFALDWTPFAALVPSRITGPARV